MRYITLAIAFLIGLNADAQIIRAEPFYTAPEAAVVTNLLLDSFPGAAVAYSLRKLDKDYTGSAIRVRRSSDNTEQDIGFLSSGHLDTSSLKTFVGANNGFVVTWYNQADSSGVFGVRNLRQTTAANQPRIVNSGTIDRLSNQPTVLFDGTSDWMWDDSIYIATAVTKVFIFSASKLRIATGNQIIASFGWSQEMGRLQQCSICGAGTSAYVGAGNMFATYTNNSTLARIITLAFDGNGANNAARLKAYENGTEKTLSFGAATVPTSVTGRSIMIGSFQKTSTWYDGTLSEIIMHPTDMVTNRSSVESNINRFYSIY